MTYDPFRRGTHPVGVRTVDLVDESRDRKLVAEVWYPTDVAGPAPFAVFSHGFAGHRRQSTFFTQHLAGHGWVVAAVDHAGNTFVDLMAQRGRPPGEAWKSSMQERPRDVRFLIDAAAAGRLGTPPVDTARVAMTGHSFGGWTALRVVADEPRIAAVVALAPAAGVPQLRAAIDLAWTREVPTMVIAAERDSLLPVAGIEAVFAELRAPATLVVIAGTDHMHFCDGSREIHELFRSMPIKLVDTAAALPPFDELAPAKHGHLAANGLGLAHLDASIRGDADARAWLAGDLAAVLREHEIAAVARRLSA
jgi:predicted dienelactone hydrolase